MNVCDTICIEESDLIMKISIKEAGRYANYLSNMIKELCYLSYTGIESKMFTVVETQKKSLANKEAIDEIVLIEHNDKIDIEIKDLTILLNNFVEEKIKLADAIANAKKDIEIEIDKEKKVGLDTAIEYAKLLRNISEEYYKSFIRLKDNKRKERQKAYAFNADGNQVEYFYDAEIELKLKYNRNDFIKENKMLRIKADRISEKIEKTMSDELVNIEPKFNYLDTMEDIVEKYRGE